MGVFVSAVIASAVTSTVFLMARREPAPADPLDDYAQRSQQIAEMLSSELEAAARDHLSSDSSTSTTSSPKVNVTFFTESPPADDEVPMVAPDEQMLMKGAPVPWQLEVVTSSGERKFGRIVDIRNTGSLTHPGYVGVVEVSLQTTVRSLARSGELPMQTPEGFQVISPAEYTELEGTQKFNVQLASSETQQWEYTYDDWAPTTPPPPELPEEVRRQFNEAIAECTSSQPTTQVSTQRLTFFYSLRERKWTPRS